MATETKLSLLQTEEQLEQRSADLQRRGENTASLDEALTAVRAAIETLTRNREQQLLAWERIELIRWQNKLEPLIMEPSADGDTSECARRRERVREIQSEGEALAGEFAEKWEHLLANPAWRSLQQAWSEMLAGCERLHDELLVQGALAATQSVPSEQVLTLAASVRRLRVDFAEARAKVMMSHDLSNLERVVADMREQEARLRTEWQQVEPRVQVAQKAGR